MTKPRPTKQGTSTGSGTPSPRGDEQQHPRGDANASSNENTGDRSSQAAPASPQPMETD